MADTFEYKVTPGDTLQIGGSSNEITIPGNITIEGTATFEGGVSSEGGIALGAGDDLTGSATSDILMNTDKFTVAGATGNVGVGGTLDVTGALDLASTVNVAGDLTVETGATLEVADDGGLSIASTAVTATAAELNTLNTTLQTETVTATGAISVDKTNTNLDTVVPAGATAYTLAACPAYMVGHIKTIRFSADNGDATVALTEVQGGTAATTATFTDVGNELILIGSAGGKWTVIKEFGVTLS